MNRRAALLFLALGVAWGIPYLLIKVAVEEISPAELVLARTALAALILLPIAIAKGAGWDKNADINVQVFAHRVTAARRTNK